MAAQTENELPMPPFVHVEGVLNFRDIGGYATDSSSKAVRKNFMYRSAQLGRITEAGKQYLVHDLGVTTIYDLRSHLETAKQRPSDIPGVSLVYAPAFDEKSSTPEKVAAGYRNYTADEGTDGFVRAYADILTHAQPSFRKIFLHIRDRPADPFVIHCMGGKDRTGVCAALALELAGVPRGDIGDEYELTEIGMDSVRQAIVALLLNDPLVASDRAGVIRMISAQRANILATLKWLDDNYGGTVDYFRKELLFTDEDIQTIRNNLVIDVEPHPETS